MCQRRSLLRLSKGKTCKVEYYLGYGGYKSGEAYRELFPAEDHINHDITEKYPTDYLSTDEKTGHLHFECPMNGRVGNPFLENYDKYTFISFQPSNQSRHDNAEITIQVR